MTFDNEFLLIHRSIAADGLPVTTKIVLEKDLEKLIGPYWAVRVVQTALNFRTDSTTVYCRNKGVVEIIRK